MFGRRGETGGGTRKVDTYIGKDTILEGTLKISGTVRIDGNIEGQIQAGADVIVGEGGVVVASVSATNVTVAGEVRGNMECSGRLEITNTGRVFGDVVVASLAVDDGAVFRGKCEMMNPNGVQQKHLPPPKPAEPVEN
ncbi:MAG: polymer-forming cytoskeletal protein [Firmicutes bacterium]|nr:polymer-forming cytoskeletal protein [Bacillota bacterium]